MNYSDKSKGKAHFIVVVIFVVSLVISILSGKCTTSASAIPPTFIDTPQKQYFLKINNLPITEWKGATDTLMAIFSLLGKSLSVDQSQEYQQIALRQMQKIGSKIILDSIVAKPKK